MRIACLLWIGISISLTAVFADTEATTKAKTKDGEKTHTTTVAPTITKTTKPASSRTDKSLKSVSDSRGKRTLYDFGNAGYLYPEIASRRAGYVSDARDSYPQSGYYDGQNAIAHYPQYSPYPQYLEAPEPIIEIIIKEANETLPADAPQPIVTKKKKEKVHVFYVNYKKDENNKLHLESPIASLNNDDSEEEEEEVVHYPAVTPVPALQRTTTLRTIIHPDSEKYHSNSGIHVTFGSEDKSQSGHILEEHDAESIQRQVVALPVSEAHGLKSSMRGDYFGNLQGRPPPRNSLFTAPFQQPPSLNVHNQQLPTQQSGSYFRPPQSHPTPPAIVQQYQQKQQHQGEQHHHQQQQHQAHYHHQQQPQHHQQQYHHQQEQHQQQRPSFSQPPPPPLPQPQALYRKPPTTQQQLQQQSNYYINHNQHYQHQQTIQHNQYYQPQTHKTTQPTKQPPFFPTPLPKTQERQTLSSYQPVKFRPTPMPTSHVQPVAIPAKLENSNYEFHQKQQSHYSQPLSQPQHQHQPAQNQQPQHQHQPAQIQQPQHQHQSSQNQQPQHQHQSHPSHQPQHQQKPYQFNRQPQYVQQPSFSVTSPTHQPNYYKQPAYTNQQQTAQYFNQKPAVSKYPQQPANNQQTSSALSTAQHLFKIQPSRETELLKSIPKFEQHITETIHHPGVQQQQSNYNFQYNTRNQVIHDIPAPNLGPTPAPAFQQQAPQPQPQKDYSSAPNGHYITASSSNTQQQFSNFVTTSQGIANSASNVFSSSTPSPVYAQSTDGQKIMIVTPMPPKVYNQYHSSQYSGQSYQQQQNSNQFAAHNYVQEPRKSNANAQAETTASNSQFSVSTYHQDVFKELEQRKNQAQSLLNQYDAQASQPSPTKPPSAYLSENTPPGVPPTPSGKGTQTALQLPAEVPDDLRQQLLSSGILNNADISVLDYDKVGDIALENLPAEHLQHFYGNGGGAQISESKKVVTVVKPNGEKVALSEKDIERVKQSNSLPHKQQLDVKLVRFDATNEKSVADQYLKPDATMVSSVDLGDRQYNRYLPLKINGAQFPIPNSEELEGKKIVSVVVLAPVEPSRKDANNDGRAEREASGEVKFLGGELIKTLVKKPTKENFKRWLEKEARTDVEQQSVVLLVAKSSNEAEQEIFMYDITTGAVNKLNGELSSAFVSLAEENASSEDLEHASTLDPSFLQSMMQKSSR